MAGAPRAGSWANSRTEKESKRNTIAEARAGEVQNIRFAAGEERLVTRRGLQDTAPERHAKVEALGLTIKPAGALDRVPGLLPLRQAPQRRLADTSRFARASAAAERSEKRGRAPRARRGEGRLFPNGLHWPELAAHTVTFRSLTAYPG